MVGREDKWEQKKGSENGKGVGIRKGGMRGGGGG